MVYNHRPKLPEFYNRRELDSTGDPVLQTTFGIDRDISDAQRKMRLSGSLPDFSTTIAEIEKRALTALRENEYSGVTTWTDYYRLSTRPFFLRELLYAPFVFSPHDTGDTTALRREMSDNAYQASAHLLQKALKEHDHINATAGEKQDLRGVVHELTSLALFNKGQNSNSITLPAPVRDDFCYKTDLIHHRITPAGYKTIAIQVKFGGQRNAQDTPRDGLLITGQDLDHVTGDLVTARAIVQEYEGNASNSDVQQVIRIQNLLNERTHRLCNPQTAAA